MTEITIPLALKIGGHDYKVRCDAVANDALDCADAWGMHRARTRELLIDSTTPPQELSKVFMHECLHAISDIYCGHRLEERDVTTLAQGLLQIMEEVSIRFVLPKEANSDLA